MTETMDFSSPGSGDRTAPSLNNSIAKEFRGFLKDLKGLDSLHKDGNSKSKDRDQKVTKSPSRKVGELKEPTSKLSKDNANKTKGKVVASQGNSGQFGFLINSHNFDSASSSFLDEEMLPDANSEKELGNEYFKQKKYLEAIECYSRSIVFRPTSVAFANRAMAFLKQRKFEEAENDCTEALNLDDRYVKAYSRRVTARKELGKFKEAMEDADFAVRLDPNNPELRKQYSEIKALLDKKFTQSIPERKPSNAADQKSQIQGVPKPFEAQKMSGSGTTSGKPLIFLDEVDERIADSMTEAMDYSPRGSGGSTAPRFNNIAKEPNVVNHKHELEKSIQDLASRATSRVMGTTPKCFTVPTTAYQFEVSWRALSDDSANQARLLKTISPPDLPKIFKNALSASILVDIVRCIANFFR
ncbi:Outer envelope protein 64, chloroplastic [Apostasia shenzhenica]|uniref:Outer envelope protein 64, chloroplastic n=1 Tax=Apostasia shenzhenica TaxID=1088818 RepID=A0A2I0AI45_9ASPA|nr:Outer envelope protein 64, chloroplastic [Apostasia shenzhenica]